MTARHIPEEVSKALAAILQPGQVTELRALDAITGLDKRPHVYGGYFDDHAKLVEAVGRIHSAKGVYFVPNPIKPELLARSVNKARAVGKDPTTSDHDIARRHWLLIDCDAKRPAGIAASDSEHGAALERVTAIDAYLAECGWEAPIIGDSGNGGHLLFRVDLPVEDEQLVKRCLEALAARFNDDLVTVDTSVHNPARIWKLYGTLNGKGDADAAALGRPQRMAKLIGVPDELLVVSREQLEALAGTPAVSSYQPSYSPGPSSSSFNIDEWIRDHGLNVGEPQSWNGGRRWIFPVCPWNPDHTDRSAYLCELPSGAIAAGCQHNGCSGNDWKSLRDMYEPQRQTRPSTGGADISAICRPKASDDADEFDDLPSGPIDPGAFPDELLKVPGFIGDVIAHNLDGAWKPQPVLAMASALALLATLTGRNITDRYGTRTNLYVVGVAGTSSGKERGRKVNKNILHLAGLDRMIGPESIGSSAGLVSAVDAQAELLMQIDEMGRFLATLGDAKQSHLYGIITVLMKLFTSSDSIYVGDAYADLKKVKTIYQPHLVISGTTTPDALYNSLTPSSLGDGFLGRILVFEGSEVAKREAPEVPTPEALVEQAKWWGDLKPPAAGNLHKTSPQPLLVPMDEGATRVFARLDDLAEVERKALGEPLGSLWPRATEKAHKLGLLYACSARHLEPLVDDAAATWACEVVSFLTRRLAFLASRWLSENRTESNTKRLSRLIEAAGPDGITKSSLLRASQWISKRDRDELIATLCDSGDVIQRTVVPAGKGRPTTVFIYRT